MRTDKKLLRSLYGIYYNNSRELFEKALKDWFGTIKRNENEN